MSTGLALSQAFYDGVVEPVIRWAMPDLRFSAAHLGDGSEVLGFDNDMSADHDYGPTVQIFLDDADFTLKSGRLMDALDQVLPEDIGGWPVRFPHSGRPDRSQEGMLGSDHGVEIYTLDAWALRQVGITSHTTLTPMLWLSIPEQRLLSVISGAVYNDDSGRLSAFRERLEYFPRDVWLKKLAMQWRLIGAEQSFVGRTGDDGDDVGSRIIAARLVEQIMRLCFLIERRYAPYAKWLGAAFQGLHCLPVFKPVIDRILAAPTSDERQRALADAYHRVGVLQKTRQVPGAIAPELGSLHNRPFALVNAEEIAAKLEEAIDDATVFALNLPGAIDQITHAAPILRKPALARQLLGAMTKDDR